MEAKDTVMNDQQIDEAVKKVPYFPNAFREVAKAHAKISFKAGIKEVIDWIEWIQPFKGQFNLQINYNS
jgi:hypothetical protein